MSNPHLRTSCSSTPATPPAHTGLKEASVRNSNYGTGNGKEIFTCNTHARTQFVSPSHIMSFRIGGGSYWESMSALSSEELSMSLDKPLTPWAIFRAPLGYKSVMEIAQLWTSTSTEVHSSGSNIHCSPQVYALAHSLCLSASKYEYITLNAFCCPCSWNECVCVCGWVCGL